MADFLSDILFAKHLDDFKKTENIALRFACNYSGTALIGEDIFPVLKNYGRKNNIDIQILRFPFQDEELWAFTFLNQETVFVCVNTGLSISKQLFATAHELYHIYCYVESRNEDNTKDVLLLKNHTEEADLLINEELEASAFAGLLLMPTKILKKWINTLEINLKDIYIDDILSLIEVFGVPFKAAILRLYECSLIEESKAKELYAIHPDFIDERISLTGLTKRWCIDGTGTEVFGSLLDDFVYNKKNEVLTRQREKDDNEYIKRIMKPYGIKIKGL